MATISSLILNSDQAENPSSPNSHETNINPTDIITPTLSEAASQDLLSEIQAIKDAMTNNESFDFTTLEATAAGQTNLNMSNDKSISSSPILLNEDSLLIQYQSNSDDEANNTQSAANTHLDSRPDANNDDPFLDDSINSDTNQIRSNVSEDFITNTRGSFEANNVKAQTVDTQYGKLVANGDGSWDYTLNNQQSDIQSLSAGSTVEDTIKLTTTSGDRIELSITINGSNDQAIITGQKQASIEALPLNDIANTQPSVSGKLNVSDIDAGEARFDTNFDIKGSFGSAQINALGEWSYTLNNTSDAVQGLRSGEQIFDLFSVKTLDGSKQLIQISIQGVDDKPLLSGKNVAVLDLETELNTQGSLTINDPDFGESAFQAYTNIQSSLGYGSADIDSQGNWTFALDSEFTSSNPIADGQTRIDSFEVFTLDGTSQTIHIPIQGSNTPLYSQTNTSTADSESLALNQLLTEPGQDNNDSLSSVLNGQSEQNNAQLTPQNTGESSYQLEASIYMNGDANNLGNPLSQNLSDIPIS